MEMALRIVCFVPHGRRGGGGGACGETAGRCGGLLGGGGDGWSGGCVGGRIGGGRGDAAGGSVGAWACAEGSGERVEGGEVRQRHGMLAK